MSTINSRSSVSIAAKLLSGSDAPPSPASLELAASLKAEDSYKQGKKPMNSSITCGLTSSDATAVAQAIAKTAHAYAQRTHHKTPWSVSACETGQPWARFFIKGGGKMDDVTVLVAFVEHA